jgi:hypothetical protein
MLNLEFNEEEIFSLDLEYNEEKETFFLDLRLPEVKPILNLEINEEAISKEFTEEENEFICVSFEKGLKISRIAYKLGRDYDDTELQMVKLKLVSEKAFEERLSCRFSSRDEIEYQLLLSGNSESDIRDEHQRAKIMPTRTSVYGEHESEE